MFSSVSGKCFFFSKNGDSSFPSGSFLLLLLGFRNLGSNFVVLELKLNVSSTCPCLMTAACYYKGTENCRRMEPNMTALARMPLSHPNRGEMDDPEL